MLSASFMDFEGSKVFGDELILRGTKSWDTSAS